MVWVAGCIVVVMGFFFCFFFLSHFHVSWGFPRALESLQKSQKSWFPAENNWFFKNEKVILGPSSFSSFVVSMFHRFPTILFWTILRWFFAEDFELTFFFWISISRIPEFQKKLFVDGCASTPTVKIIHILETLTHFGGNCRNERPSLNNFWEPSDFQVLGVPGPN